jgi:anaerobic selenocysteine-containing dehydrogenase
VSEVEHYRTCPLCEATCGLAITMRGDQVTSIRGDEDDVFSKGFICPKGTALKHLHEDPDRLRRPMVRVDGELRETTWEEAYAALEAGLAKVLSETGKDTVALYLGNPTVHSLSASVMTLALAKVLGTRNLYSAATVDQMPKHVSCGLMFGRPDHIPVPDIDRTDYMLIVGANPFVSNGSLATAPDFRGRMEGIRRRGGKVVVVDPRRTETASGADEYIPIRPGTDALFLLAIVNTLFDEDLINLGHVADFVNGLDDIRPAIEGFTPDSTASVTGVPAQTTERIAREIATAPTAVVYDRVGAHQQGFGTLTSWAADVITTLTGNLDRPGGKMFALAAHAKPDPDSPGGRGWSIGRFTSRVSDRPEAYGQLPISVLAEEIETPGEGQVRALITVGGNPVLSTPNGVRLARALESLEFIVSVDPYLNETTRFADVILPPPSVLAKHHYDFAFYGLSVRNIANYSPPIVEAEGPDEWDSLARIAAVCLGQSAVGDPSFVPQMALAQMVQEATADDGPLSGLDPAEILQTLSGEDPVVAIVDFRIRVGPYGDLFGKNPDGLSVEVLRANPHGVDLGPLKPRLPNGLRTRSGKVELAPQPIIDDIPRLRALMDRDPEDLVVIGRRQLRSNNSWMHNIPKMITGSNRCTLLVHPADAERLGVTQGMTVKVASRVGAVEVEAEITDDMMPGVVSLPHGWGHSAPGVRLSVAAGKPGVSSNDLTDEYEMDPLSGNSVMSGIPVRIEVAVDA